MIMKKNFKIMMMCATLCGLTACSDFLEQTSPSELQNKNVYESVYYTNLALNNVYGGLTQDYTYSQYIPIVWGLNSDCELVDGLGDDAYNTSSERGNMNYNANPGWANLAKLWDAMYGIIENANLVVDGVAGSSLVEEGNPDRQTMLRFRAEAMTLRAMCYFDMIRFFGDIPMKMESTNPDLSNAYLSKTDRDSIMDRLMQDLDEAINYLPWAGEAGYTTEHVTKGYAHALLANIALTRAGWNIREQSKADQGYITAMENSDPQYPTQRCSDEKRTEMYELALQHLSAIIVSNVHKLNPSIENYWYLINQRVLDQNYRENLFEIPMGLAKSGELGYTVGVRINGASTKYGQKGNSSGKLKLTAPYFWSFDRKDLRRDLTCANYQLKQNDKGLIVEEMLGNSPFGIYCAKWDIRKMSEEWRLAAIAAGDGKLTTGINVVRMRYPQVLLMYAEVMNELYGPDAANENSANGMTARMALKEVHMRAFADTDKAYAEGQINAIAGKDDFFDAIVDENAWELAGEGFRKFDLIRWNLLSEKIDQFKKDYMRQVNNYEYPEKVYFKYKEDGCTIDMSSVDWYGELGFTEDVEGYESKTFWGAEVTDSEQKNLQINLPSISSGLNATVKNRYLLPIASTTISASNGHLHNSYGYTD